MEPKVGQVSGVLEEREHGFPRGSKRWAGRDYGWQTQESFEKVLSMRRGGAFFDFTRKYIGDPITKAITSSDVYQENIEPLMQMLAPVAEQVEPIIRSSAIGQTLEDAEIVTEGAREELRQRGWDPRGADVGKMLAEEAVGGVLGKTVGMAGRLASSLPPPSGGMALATATAGAAYTPPMSVAPSFERGGTVMKAVTTQHTEALGLAGRQTGEDIIGQNPTLAKHLMKRRQAIVKKKDQIQIYEDQLEALDELKGDPRNLMFYINDNDDLSKLWDKYTERGEPNVFQKVRDKVASLKATAQPQLSQLQSNVLEFAKEGDYSKWYGSEASKPFKKASEKILRAKGDLKIKEYLQQHHLLPKGMSAAYFNKMDELIAAGKAQLDDLVVMAEVARAKGMPTGDVKANIEDLVPTPHGELHTALRADGAEIPKSKLTLDLSKVDNVDQLMELWVREFDPDGNFTYNVETAKVWTGLDKLLKELRGS